jgi:hypothetical protein
MKIPPRLSIPFATLLAIFACSLTASADSVGTYGDTTVVTGPDSQPAWQLSSLATSGSGYSGVYLGFTSPIAPSALTELSANYVMTTGTFGGGAPRFSIIDSTNNASNEAYVYFGTPLAGGAFNDPNIGNTSYASTGNYANLSSPDIRVQVNGFGGYSSGASYQTWSQFLADPFVSGTTISYITIDLDGGFTGNQVMDIGSFNINGTVYAPAAVPEPSSTYMVGIAAALALVGGALRKHYSRPQ